MRMHRRLFLLAAAAVALAVSGNQAKAAYTYSTALTVTSVSGGGTFVNTPGTGASATSGSGNSSVTLQDILTPGTVLVPGALTANIGNLGVGTASPTPESFTVNYTDVITIINPAPGPTPNATFTITGSLVMVGLQNVGGATAGVVSNIYTGTLNQGPVGIGGNFFAMNFGNGLLNDFFGPPTIEPTSTLPQTTSGSLGAQITATVPEPTSMALIGIGLTGLLGYSWRRREVARRLAA